MVERTPITTLASLRSVTHALAKANVPVIVEGPPGVGKTACFESLASEMGGNFCEVRPVTKLPEDFNVPIIDTQAKKVHWVQSLFPDDPNWEGIVLIDEIGSAREEVQTVMLGLLNFGERRLGSYVLPKKARLVATTNRISDKAGVHQFISPIVSRVCTVEFLPDTSRSLSERTYNDEFVDYLSNKPDRPAAGDVTSFIRAFPDRLLDFDPDRVNNSPTPRSWDMLSAVLQPDIRPTDRVIADGIIGPSAACDFCAFRDLSVKIDPEAIIRNPERCTIPVDMPSHLWATVGCVARFAKHADNDQLNSIATYLMRCPAEYAVFGMMDAMSLSRNIIRTKSASLFIEKYGSMLNNKS